jgi:membrane-associated phospholipid phosphatase
MTLNLLLFITFVTLYHFKIHNKLEKLFSQTHFHYNDIKRPSAMCDDAMNEYNFNCVGMPSGHAEASSVLCFTLYYLKLLPLWASLLIVGLVSMQRVVYRRHTILQVVMGSILGLAYAFIYKYFNYSIISLVYIFTLGLILFISTSVYETIHLNKHPLML